MAKVATVIGIETFSDRRITEVQYAENDAKGLDLVLQKLGYQTTLLLSGQATKTATLSKLKKVIRQLGPDDTFLVFIASHGFSEGGRNYVAAHDTQADDRTGTSLAVQRIFDMFKRSNCQRCCLFLDACETGIEGDASTRGHLAELSEDQLREALDTAEYFTGFAACRAHEKSYSSPRLEHGIWTHCLIRALSGQAAAATDGKGRVTAATLQAYLSHEVPRELLTDWGPGARQSPWQFGGLSRDFVIADVAALGVVPRTSPKPATTCYALDDGRNVEVTLPAGGMTMEQCLRFCLYLMSMAR